MNSLCRNVLHREPLFSILLQILKAYRGFKYDVKYTKFWKAFELKYNFFVHTVLVLVFEGRSEVDFGSF